MTSTSSFSTCRSKLEGRVKVPTRTKDSSAEGALRTSGTPYVTGLRGSCVITLGLNSKNGFLPRVFNSVQSSLSMLFRLTRVVTATDSESESEDFFFFSLTRERE